MPVNYHMKHTHTHRQTTKWNSLRLIFRLWTAEGFMNSAAALDRIATVFVVCTLGNASRKAYFVHDHTYSRYRTKIHSIHAFRFIISANDYLRPGVWTSHAMIRSVLTGAHGSIRTSDGYTIKAYTRGWLLDPASVSVYVLGTRAENFLKYINLRHYRFQFSPQKCGSHALLAPFSNATSVPAMYTHSHLWNIIESIGKNKTGN